MHQRLRKVVPATVVALVCLSANAFAQVGNIAGVVRDSSGAVLPGVAVQATSPQLIGSARSTVTDGSGRYQIASLPVGVYKVTFALDGFTTLERVNIELSTDFTAPVNVVMAVGARTEVVEVIGALVPLVDVQNARQRQVITGEELVELPTTRNLGDLASLVPGIALPTALFSASSEPTICSGGQGQGAFSGALSGCSPIFAAFNAHSSMNDGDSLNQGRLQLDGMGVQSFLGGGRSSYVADVGQAQEISFTLSGSLGESETGGTTINVVPRTGSNRFTGNYFTGYSSGRFFGSNGCVAGDTTCDRDRSTTFSNRLIHEYDINGAFGGPIKRDRLWFYANARRQDRENMLTGNFRNLNAGIYGANYAYDPSTQLNQGDRYQNAATRLTIQATRRDKLNVFWDEQYTCENPCRGGGAGVSVEATASSLTRPLRLTQLSWTNPLSNRFLLEGGVSYYYANLDWSRHRFEDESYPGIPRIVEAGSTNVAPGSFTTGITSGSVNNASRWKTRNVQSRASVSYVTGTHNVKLGYQGQTLARVTDPYFNDIRMTYNYATPGATCTATKPTFGAVTNEAWCGLFPDGRRIFDGLPESAPLGTALTTGERPPVPTSVTTLIPAGQDEMAWFGSVCLQDQWTWNRFTLSGALRYDHAQSSFGKTCVGPDVWTDFSYCLNDPALGDDGSGVSFNDITPRWGVAWDVFGTGKTAIKYSMGKYLQGSSASGIYTATNAAGAGRTINSYQRVWRDLNGNRRVDCNLKVPAVAPAAGQALPSNGECGSPVIPFGGTAATAAANSRRFGRSPNDLDELGLAVGLGTLYCGQNERSMSQFIRSYCDNYLAAGGSTLINGWGKRQYEWQYSIGIQHELLPRLSAEVTYNRRDKGNVTVTDALLSGCDLYSSTAGAASTQQQCLDNLMNFRSPDFDFFGVRAPVDPRLPDGGGYVIDGIATQKVGVVIPAGAGVNAITIAPKGSIRDYWNGVDTNFVWRSARGLRVSGGTSTGRRVIDNCGLVVDAAGGQEVRGAQGLRACNRPRPFQTNLRGTASYTIPRLDVLISSTFSMRPGVEVFANYTIDVVDVVWAPGSQSRIGTTALVGGAATVQRDLNFIDVYGERITLIDLKVAKNIRFHGKRANIGVDIYNALNSDAARAYCNTFPNPARGIEGCGATATNNLVEWGEITNIVTPRYARLQVRFDF